MKNGLIVVLGVMLITTMGCTLRYTEKVIEELQPDVLYESYKVNPTNLKAQSKCQFSPTVKIVNIETREDEYAVFNNKGDTHTINRKELTRSIVEYLKYGFQKSQIIIDDNSNKIINISFVDAKAAGFWSFEANIKIKVDIPEINYSVIHEAKDLAVRGFWFRAMAYASHGVTRKIIEDPTVQDYILCNLENKQPSQPEKKLKPQQVDIPAASQSPLPAQPQIIKPSTPEPATNIIIVTGTSANIRSGAGNEFSIITTVKQGDKLVLLGEHGDWFNVRLEKGQEGWINSKFVKEK